MSDFMFLWLGRIISAAFVVVGTGATLLFCCWLVDKITTKILKRLEIFAQILFYIHYEESILQAMLESRGNFQFKESTQRRLDFLNKKRSKNR